MKAHEARAISNENKITLQAVLSGIAQSAKQGDTQHITPPGKELTLDIIQELTRKGYSIKEHTDPFNGMTGFIIGW